MSREIQLPLTEQIAVELQPGDEIELTGFALTARDQACARLFKMIQDGAKLPVELGGQLLYFVGPSPAPDTVLFFRSQPNL